MKIKYFSIIFKLRLNFNLHRNIYTRFEKPTTVMFVLRVMVGAIILYDHVHPAGAFHRKSNIDVSIII